MLQKFSIKIYAPQANNTNSDLQCNKIESPEINQHTYGYLIFLTEEARIYNGEKTISLKSGARKTGQPSLKGSGSNS